MLGRYLEYSVATPDIQASFDFYSRLGFSQAQVGEAWPHRYAVLTDGRLCIGLHEAADFASSLTFVKPELLKHLRPLEQAGVEFEIRRLGDMAFNEVGWRDPSGHMTRLVEARTFSPLERSAIESSLCGYFSEFALPVPDLKAAKTHWERLGFVGMDEMDHSLPHIACTSDTVDIGLYELATLKLPTLRFTTADVALCLANLANVGILPSARSSTALRQMGAALIVSPEGLPLMMAPEHP